MTISQLLTGPLLRYVKSDTKEWKGSALIVINGPLDQPPFIKFSLPDLGFEQGFQADFLYTLKDSDFWRFSISLPVDPHNALCYSYSIDVIPNTEFHFNVPPGEAKSWRWGFYSCNGFTEEVTADYRERLGGTTPLWEDLLRRHTESPLFALVGCGDQIYADAVWHSPTLQQWLNLRGMKHRFKAPWSQEMEEEVTTFYFNEYCRCFTLPSTKDAFASIPQINMIDDHDMFDGLGSYPEYLEESQVFKNIKRIAYKFYLLFQHQITHELAKSEGYIGTERNSYSLLKMLGSEQALLALDCRAERTMEQIVSPVAYQEVFASIDKLSQSVKHLAVVTGVPVIYPRLNSMEHTLNHFGIFKRRFNKGFNKVSHVVEVGVKKVFGHQMRHSFRKSMRKLKISMGKTGMLSSALNQFGEPDLCDDMVDHWTNEHHMDERHFFISHLQDFALRKGVRVTFIAGDVHLATAGRLFNPEYETDHRLMFQIVSSAIVNIPPPTPAVFIEDKASCGRPVSYDNKVEVVEEMIELFKVDVDDSKPLTSSALLPRRNWCLVEPCLETDEIKYSLMIENIDYRKPTIPYSVMVPKIRPMVDKL